VASRRSRGTVGVSKVRSNYGRLKGYLEFVRFCPERQAEIEEEAVNSIDRHSVQNNRKEGKNLTSAMRPKSEISEGESSGLTMAAPLSFLVITKLYIAENE
jgi:hypothetical protein